MNWLFKRLQEPSTGAGLAMAALLAKSNPAWAQYADLFNALAGLGAAHAIAVPEAKAS
jgi:hypothetical protein